LALVVAGRRLLYRLAHFGVVSLDLKTLICQEPPDHWWIEPVVEDEVVARTSRGRRTRAEREADAIDRDDPAALREVSVHLRLFHQHARPSALWRHFQLPVADLVEPPP